MMWQVVDRRKVELEIKIEWTVDYQIKKHFFEKPLMFTLLIQEKKFYLR